MPEAIQLKPITTAKRPCLLPEFTDDYGGSFEMGLNKKWLMDPLSISGWGNRVIVSYPKRVVVGCVSHSYIRDFYYRVHVTPVYFNTGNITGDTLLRFKVFNAFFKNVELLRVEYYNAEGVETNIVTPKTMLPLAEHEYVIKVTTNGPPTINAAIKLFFDVPSENRTVRVEGTRSVVLPFMTIVGQSERLEWLTTIAKSRDGSEERTSVRHTPRWTLSCRFDLPERGDRRVAENLGLGWVKRDFTIPFWHKSTQGVKSIAPGDTTIMCDTSDCEFAPGNNIILWANSHDYEMTEIVEVMPDRLVVGVVKSAKHNFMVVPVYNAIAPNGVSVAGTSVGGEMSATFDISHISKYYTPDVYQNFDGFAIMPFKAYGDEPRDNITTRVDTFDDKVGSILFNTPELRPTLDRPFSLFVEGRRQYTKLKNWLSYCSGQYRAFLYDTNMHDMELLSRGIISNTFEIRSDRFTGMSSVFRNRIVVEKFDNTKVFAKILGSSDDGKGRETVLIDTNLSCDATTIKRIGFLMCGRFASDTFVLKTLGRNRFSVSVTFKEI